MAKARAEIDIRRSPEVVWAYLTDFPRNPEWLTQVTEVRTSTTTPGLGTRITEFRRVPGRTVQGVVEVTDWQPAERLRKTSPAGSLRADGIYDLVANQDGGTHLTFSLDIRGSGIAKVVEWLLGRGLQGDTEQVLRNLKQRLESSSGA